jgi:protein TonB
MFEDSLFSSQPKPASQRMRLLTLLCICMELLVVTVIVALPYMYPATLPVVFAAPRAVLLAAKPLPKPEPPKPQVVRTSSTQALRAHVDAAPQIAQIHGGNIAQNPRPATDDAPLLAGGTGMKGAPLAGPGLGTADFGSTAVGVAPAAPTAKAGTLRVSSGVSTGLLLAPIQPVYPAIARAARQGGTVIVLATIDKQGRIVNARALSGPIMLQSAAVEAVARARYKPYLLNGQPADVETTVSITFNISG